MQPKHSPVHIKGTPSLHEDEALDAFFDLRTALVYFASIRQRVNDRLDGHEIVLPAYERWFSVEEKKRYALLDEFVVKRKKRKNFLKNKNTGSLKSVWERGDEFFPPESRSSLELLKKARIQAAKKLHPDVGGSNHDMQQLNNAYDILHEILTNDSLHISIMNESPDHPYADHGGNPLSFDPDSYIEKYAAFYRNAKIRDELLAAAYFNLLINEWNLDKAAIFFGDGSNFESLISREEDIGDEGESPDLQRFAGLCYRLNRPDICDNILSTYQNVRLSDTINTTRNDNNYKRIRLKSDHPKCRGNIDRLAHISLPWRTDIEAASTGNEILSSVFDFKFHKLPCDPPAGTRPTNISLIPHPWGSPEELTPEQAWQYHDAFYDTREARLVERYGYARIWALMESLIFHGADPVIILSEVATLKKILHKDIWFSKVAKFCDFFAELSEDEQKQRIKTLKNLHDVSLSRGPRHYFPDEEEYSLVFSIKNYLCFIDTAMLPLDRLDLAIKSGRTKTAKDEKRGKESWKRLTDFLHKNKPSWDDFIAIQKYIDACLEFSKKTEHVEEFQICYWYDRLTVSLVKQKKWDEANDRLEQMFSLPDRFFQRSNRSEQETLRRRLARCRKMLGQEGA